MSVDWFGATLEVSVAFGKGASETVVDGDYTDISAYVRNVITIDRGRSSELDTFQTGTLALDLDNRDRRFDPDYSAGPHYGDLTPNVHIRVRLTYSASTSYLFKGYVSGWPQVWDISDNDGIARIIAHDWFKLAARARLPVSTYAAEVLADSPLAWYRLGEQDGTAMLDSSGNSRHGQYANGAVFNTRDPLIAYDDDNSIEFDAATKQYGTMPFTFNSLGLGSVTVEFWWNSTATTEVTGTILGAAESSTSISGGAGTYFYVSVPDTGVASGKFFFKMISPGASGSVYSSVSANTGATKHVVICSRNGSAPVIYVNGVDVSTGGTSGSGVVFTNLPALHLAAVNNWGGHYCSATIDEVAIYDGELNSTRVLAHYNAGANGFASETVDARIDRLMSYAGYSTFPTSLAASTQTVQGLDLRSSPYLREALQQLETTEGGQGRIYVAADGTLTFRDRYYDTSNPTVATAFSDASGSTYPYSDLDHEYDDARVINDATVSRANGASYTATDSTSRTANGWLSANVQTVGESDAEVVDRANALIYQYKTARKRIRALTVKPRKAPATLFPTVRTTDVSTRISVRRLPLSVGSAWTQELTVEGVRHEIGVNGSWVANYLTAPTDVAGEWLILDSATQGVLDTNRLGF